MARLRTALVTGATGCLGQALCAELAQGWRVISLSRHATPPEAATARHLALDLARDPLPPEMLEGVEVVFHCAALSSAWGREADFHAANVTATARLMRAARGAGVARFVYVSTPSIYIGTRSRLNVAEDAPLPREMITPYARSKFWAEQEVLAASAPGFATVALRPRAIYGRHDRALMPRLLRAIDSGAPLPLPGGGAALIDPTHASDAARALRLAAEVPAGRIGGRAYNITSGEAVRLSDLLDLLEGVTGRKIGRIPVPYAAAMAAARLAESAHRLTGNLAEPPLTRHAVAAMGLSLTLDISAARRDLGYTPQVALADGLADLLRPRVPARAASRLPEVTALRIGSCLAPATGMRADRPPLPLRVPALAFFVTHPDHGATLFDTGFGRAEAPRSLSDLALSLATPAFLPEAERLPDTLARLGVTPARILLSHLHRDHAGGLCDLEAPPPTLASRTALAALSHPPTLGDAVPQSLAKRLQMLVETGTLTALEDLPAVTAAHGFGPGHDLTGDGSAIAVALPGHGTGQVGLWLPETTHGPTLLAADAAYSLPALRADALPPAPLLATLGDARDYRATFALLRRLDAEGVRILLSHDPRGAPA